MIQLLFLILIVAQMALILTLVFETRLQNLAMMTMDRLNQGWALVISRTVKGVLLAALASSIYSSVRTHHHSIDAGSVNPTDEVLVANKMLLASLMGLLLFFSIMMQELHLLVREHCSLKKMIIATEKQLGERKYQAAEHTKALEKEITKLNRRIEALEFYYERKSYHANTATANEMALRKQSEDYKLECNRLLEYNEILQNQLQEIDVSVLNDNHNQLQSIDVSVPNDNKKIGWASLKSNLLGVGLVQFPWGTLKSTKSIGALGPDIGVQTTKQSDHYPSSGSRAISLPRHWRPMYQQISLLHCKKDFM